MRKTEIAIEQENETKILQHQSDLHDRSGELSAEIRRLEDKQRKVSYRILGDKQYS
jgi:hypothetical protein